jgi:4-hydroxybenzoyl-CoA thioesterase
MHFRSLQKIRFGDIDRAGIVYYPRFLHYFHVALEEFFDESLCVAYPTMINDYDIGLPTVHLEADFQGPLRYGDKIEVEVRVLAVGNSSIRFGYRVFRQGEDAPRVTGHNVTACVDMLSFEKKRIPDFLRDCLERHLDPR